MNDDLQNLRNKLIFRSDHRGTKEMDLILGSFAKEHVPHMNAQELAQFEEILKENDPNLYNWITGKEDPPANVVSDVFEKIKAHKFA
jgi:antitoxin CptB